MRTVNVGPASRGTSRLTIALLALLAGRAAAVEPVRVAPDVYAVLGEGGAPSAQNRGRVANAGFIVGPSGVVVIDSGISLRHGRSMLEAIRRTTDRPIKLVVLTHAMQEFVFGIGAFTQQGASVIAHRETRTLMKARCQACLEHLRGLLGEEMEGTELLLPDRIVDSTTQVSAGGVRLELLYLGPAATPGDVVVLHPASAVAFTGGLVTGRQIPQLRDGDFAGWLSALQELRAAPVRRIVPGFGAIGGRELIDSTAGYLCALEERVAALYRSQIGLVEALQRSELEAYRDWPGYEAYHGRNALHRYLQIEARDLGAEPRSTASPAR
jgi:glyoxylase-like metal-dependent hydrolase (beta-lactamase superfamily II)